MESLFSGYEKRTLTLKSYGLTVTVDAAPGAYARLTMSDSEHGTQVSMELDDTEVRSIIGFLQANLD